MNRIIHEKQNAQELVQMSQTRAKQSAIDQERKLMHLRRTQFNNLVQMISRIMFENLSELLFENKKSFTSMFIAAKPLTQFEISLVLD